MLVFLALASALVIKFPNYQAYEISYTGPNCEPSSIFSISLYSSYSDQVSSSGTLNSICVSGMSCTALGSGSYERVCVHGLPRNLGALVFDMWSCDSGTQKPFADYYTNPFIPSNRELYDLKSFRAGCYPDSYWYTYYNFVQVNAGGAGCAVYDNGYCGTGNQCTEADCSAAPSYQLASASSGCADSTYYVECATTPFNFASLADVSSLFYVDESQILFSQGDCSESCPSYWLGDGYCDIQCSNSDCDYDCSATLCDCCSPDSCCRPAQFGISETQCCSDNPSLDDNINYALTFEACLCDSMKQIDIAASLDSNGVCEIETDSFNGEQKCGYAIALSYCYGNAAHEYEYAAVGSFNPKKRGDLYPAPSCLGPGAVFDSSASALDQCSDIRRSFQCSIQCDGTDTLKVFSVSTTTAIMIGVGCSVAAVAVLAGMLIWLRKRGKISFQRLGSETVVNADE
jgi:hypothetical protein